MLMPFQPYRDLGPAEEMASQRRPRPVAVDAYRRGDELKVELDLPGADPGSIELTVENGLLSVKATRTAFWDKTDEVQVEERAYGQFGRQLFLGKSLDLDHITAIYHDGVLTVSIPVAEQAKPHKVEVTHVGSVAQAVEAASSAIGAEGEVPQRLARIGWPAWLRRAREGTTTVVTVRAHTGRHRYQSLD